MSKLDRNRPFGEVHGDHPACYEQDGKLFNHAEDEIEVEDILGGDGRPTGSYKHRVVGASTDKQKAPAKAESTAKQKAPAKAGKAESTTKAGKAEGAADVPDTDTQAQIAAQLGDSGDNSFE